MNAYYFRRDKTAVLGAIKAQLPFSESKYQLLNSWNKVLFPTNFYYLNFQLPHPNRSNVVSSHKYPFKEAKKRYEKAENCILSLFPIFCSLGAPDFCGRDRQVYSAARFHFSAFPETNLSPFPQATMKSFK